MNSTCPVLNGLTFSLALTLSFAFFQCETKGNDQPAEVDVFVSGKEGYDTFRIPSVIRTRKGTLLAFCEGRKNSRSDTGNIDLVMKKSFDGGKTWSKLQVIWDDKSNTCGNPCPVIDPISGRIWLPMTWNLGSDSESEIIQQKSEDTRRVFMTYSDDDGKTWDKPYEITSQVKHPNWSWYATGPAIGIVVPLPAKLRSESEFTTESKFRFVIPCDHKETVEGKLIRRSHCFYSDDRGKTWKLSDLVGTTCNESTVAELSDHRLVLNMRNYSGEKKRMVSFSKDQGVTWSEPKVDATLIEPVCQGCLLKVQQSENGKHTSILHLFSNPASTKREKMTVRVSKDDCKTWSVSKTIHKGSSAYSCLTVCDDTSNVMGLLYEKENYSRICFHRFTLEWLLGH